MDGSKSLSPPSHLRLYRQLARVLARHGGKALLGNTSLARWAGHDDSTERQVHRARLRTGEGVILKVQRPDVRDRVTLELKVLHEVSALLDRHTELGRVWRELSTSLSRELDYLAEANNLERLRKQLRDFESLVVPRPYRSYSTRRCSPWNTSRGASFPKTPPSHSGKDAGIG
ncbi:MAG: hypothetical protein HY319_30420 [Armatimonadetes bacterium]|nr:hypothetical protein [Armatimonadota bacterium]